MVANVTKISQKIKKSLLSIEKKYYGMKKKRFIMKNILI